MYRLLRILLALFVCVTMGAIVGCEEENPAEAENELQQANLFSIAVGHHWVFNAYALDTTNNQKILNSDHREASYVQGTTTVAGKTAYRMIDSTYRPNGSIESIDTTYIAVENGSLFLLFTEVSQNLWVKFFDASAGVNNEYTGGQFQVQDGGIIFTATFKGKIYPKEMVTVPAGTIEAYKTEIKISVAFAGQTYEWLDQQIYFAEGYGPIKMSFPVRLEFGEDIKSFGSESLLVSKNF